MNGVLGMAGLILETGLNPEQREYADRIVASGEALMTIINDILDFSKIEAGKLDLEILDFDLRTTIDEMNDILAVKAHEKGLEYVSGIDPAMPCLLKGDPGRIRQVLINLISNAVKFTENGEIRLRIWAESQGEDSLEACFEVSDTGIGIPADKLDYLFDSFTQADSSTSRKYGGTGLGLAISRNLVNMMGGKIGAKSRENQGSVFWFRIPLKKQAAWMAPPLETPRDLRGRRILVVDDNETNRMILKRQLDLLQVVSEEAPDGPSALDRLKAAAGNGRPFDIAIIDHQMPGMDGAELGQRIKDDDTIRETLMIMMTSVGQRGDSARMRGIGFSAYFTKPVKQYQLFNCLFSVVGLPESPDISGPQKIVTRFTLAEERLKATRVLLAEDNVTNQLVVTGILKKKGMRIVAVANGQEALEALRHAPYDVVLMDVQMPEMDGLEATSRIREEGSGVLNRQVYIIAMTAHAMTGDRERCLAAGMDDYISKPVRPGELFAAIEKGIRRRDRDLTGEKDGDPESLKEASPGTDDFDPNVLMERLEGDREMIGMVLEIFVKESTGIMNDLETAVKSENMEDVRKWAHSLKGSSGNIGAAALQEAAALLEKAGLENNRETLRDRFADLEKAFTRTVRSIDVQG